MDPIIYYGSQYSGNCSKIVEKCDICAKKNPKTEPPQVLKDIELRDTKPGENWEEDFTMMPKTTGNFQYLLEFTDTSTSWVEFFSCHSEKFSEVFKTL